MQERDVLNIEQLEAFEREHQELMKALMEKHKAELDNQVSMFEENK